MLQGPLQWMPSAWLAPIMTFLKKEKSMRNYALWSAETLYLLNGCTGLEKENSVLVSAFLLATAGTLATVIAGEAT
jgi:hypothetical protein